MEVNPLYETEVGLCDRGTGTCEEIGNKELRQSVQTARMISHESPVPRLVSIDRRQMLLRTVDVEKLVDDQHSVRSIWALVGRLELRLYHA